MKPSPEVSVVVVSYNTRDLLIDCLSSIIESTVPQTVEIIVVDNASTDGSQDAVGVAFPQIRTIANKANLGFGAACNQGIRASMSPLILLLNSDARLTPEAFAALRNSMLARDWLGAAGCRLVDLSGRKTINTRNFLTPFNQALELLGFARKVNSKWCQRTHFPSPDENRLDCTVDWISGACLMLRRAALDDVGLFDEQFFMYSEDEDLCLRLKQNGWTICYSTSGTVLHHGAASSARNETEMLRQFYFSQILFLSKHRGSASVRMYLAAMTGALFLKRLVARFLPSRKVNGEQVIKRQRALQSAWLLTKRANSAD